MSIEFGTGGWRAIIGDGFTKANVQRLTAALARKMKDEGVADRGFLAGYDRRFLSAEAAHWAAEVMAGAGVPCMVVEREAPTPLIMFAVRYYELSYGMAVTASHNPALYNGVKVFTKGGRDADETVTGSIEEYIAALPEGDIPVVPYEEGIHSGQTQRRSPSRWSAGAPGCSPAARCGNGGRTTCPSCWSWQRRWFTSTPTSTSSPSGSASG